MLHLDIQKGKEVMKMSDFKKDLGGTAACTKILTMAKKGCGQMASNDTHVCDSWFSGVKMDE